MNKAALAFALLVFPAFVHAQLSVSVEPLGSGAFYPNEVRYFHLTVTNSSAETLRNVEVLLLSPEASLPIEGVDGKERRFTFTMVRAWREESRDFEVKALNSSPPQITVSAEASSGGLNASASQSVAVSSSPVAVTIIMPKGSVQPGETSEAGFLVSNDSNGPVSSLRAELFSSGSSVVESSPFEHDSLEAGGQLSGSVGFKVSEDFGGGRLLLRLFFDDSTGTHVFEFPLAIEVDSKGIYALALIALVLLVAIYHFYMRGFFGAGESGAQKKKDGKWTSR